MNSNFPSQLIFIDSSVPQAELLLLELPSDYKAITLTDQTDAIDQICQHLRNYQGLEALHIVTHGSPGQLHFSNAILSNQTLNQYWNQLASWSATMAEGADILLYGCKTGQGEIGQSFIENISNITGCNVAAAESYIGHSSLDADWLLTQVSGTISSSVFAAKKVKAAWHHHLADVIITNSPNTTGSSNGGHTTGQSFTATKTGLLTEIAIVLGGGGSGTGTLTIYNGEGTGGSVLYTETGIDLTVDTFTNPSAYTFHSISIDSNVAITSGSIYTFNLSPAGSMNIYYSSTAFAGGQMYVSEGAQSGFDMVFKATQIDANADPSLIVDDLSFTEGNTTQVDSSVTANDGDGDADWDTGAKLEVQITANNEASDQLSIGAIGNITVDGSAVKYSGTTIGTISETSGTNDDGVVTSGDLLTINLNSSATNAAVKELVEAIQYSSSSDTPTASNSTRTITYTLTDKDGGSATDISTVTITAVNDDPTVATNTGSSLNEGAVDTISNTELNEGDPDDSGTGLTYTITTDASNGQLFLDADGDGVVDGGEEVDLNDTFTQDDIDNSRLKYAHDGGETTSDSFIFSLADGGENGASAVSNQTFNITIAGLNDGPTVATNTGSSLNEGAVDTISNTELNEGDPDDSGTGLTYTITTDAANGQLFRDADGDGVVDSGEEVDLNDTFTQDDIDNSRLKYAHDGSETTSDSFIFSLADGGENGAGVLSGQTFNLTISAQNDGPSIATNTGSSLNEGAVDTISNTELNEGDVDDSGTGLTYTITTDASNGQLFLDADGDGVVDGGEEVDLNDTFTQDDIDNSRLKYAHDGSETTSDSFIFSLADGGENGASAITNQIFNLTIAAQNDAPSIANNNTSAVNEGAEDIIHSGELNEGDPDDDGAELTYTVTTDVSNGQLYVDANDNGIIDGGEEVDLNDTFTQDDINNNRLIYAHDGSETSSDSFVFSLADGGEDGASTVTNQTFNLNVSSVNDEPTLTATGDDPSYVEGADTVSVFSSTAIDAIEAGQNISTLTFTVTNVAGDGSTEMVTLDGVEFALTHGNAGTTTINNSFAYSVVLSGGTATITVTKPDTAANWQTLIDGIQYRNSGTGLDGNDRVFTLAELVDAGGTANSGDDTATLSVSSTVSTQAAPAVSSVAYNYTNNTLVVTGSDFVTNDSGVNNDIDITKLTFTGEGDATYQLSTSSSVDIDSATQISMVLTGDDLINVERLLNRDGVQAADGSSNYNLAFAEDWMTGTPTAAVIVSGTNGITVSNYTAPDITGVTYNATTGALVVSGTNFVANDGANNDVDAGTFTLTGEGGETYQLQNTSDVDLFDSTQFTLILDSTDKDAINQILNKDGTASTGGTNYNLNAAEDWMLGTASSVDVVDGTNSINASPAATPVITSALYNTASGVLDVIGEDFLKLDGDANDIDLSQIVLTGKGGTYTLTSSDVDITSSTSFTVTLNTADRTALESLFDTAGTQSSSGITYNLAAQEGWNAGYGSSGASVDLFNNDITATLNQAPTITGTPSDITTLTEDTQGNIDLSAVTFADDDGDTLTVTLTGSAGTFASPADGASTGVSGVVETLTSNTVITLVGSAADINTYLDTAANIQYTGATDASGDNAATITISATDGSDNLASNPSVNLDIGVVNDAPVIGSLDGDSTQVSINASEYIDDNNVAVTDVDGDASTLNYNGGYVLITRTSGTADGSFSCDPDTDFILKFGTTEGGADGSIAGGDTVWWEVSLNNYVAIGTVDGTKTGQSGADLRIDFNTDDASASVAEEVIKFLKYSAPTEGDRVFSVTVNDSTDTSTAASFTMQVVDDVAPTVLSIERQTPSDSTTNADSLVWRVTFSEAVTAIDTSDFSVSGTTGTVTNVSSAGGNAYDITVSGGDLADYDGVVSLSFAGGQNITDTAGTPNALTNTAPSGTNNASYILDNTAPGALTLALDSDTGSSNSDGVTKNGTINVSGISSGNTWEYSIDGGSNWSDGSSTTFALAEDDYAIDDVQVRQKDSLGNTSAAEGNSIAWTIDQTSPGVPSIALNNDTGVADNISTDGTITVSGLEAGASWKYTLTSGAPYTQGAGNSFELPNGTYHFADIIVISEDLAGNESSIFNFSTITVVDADDVTSPSFTLTSDTGHSNSDYISNQGEITVSGLASGNTWEYSLDGGDNWAEGSGTTFTLGNGTHEAGDVQVRQTDYLGTVSSIRFNATDIVIDTTAPATPSFDIEVDSGQSAGDFISNNGGFLVSGLEADATWQYTIDGGTWLDGTGDTFTLPEGSYTNADLQVRQTDVAGNTSGVSSPGINVEIDQTAPDAPNFALTNDTGDSDSDGISGNGEITVTGLEAGGSWEYSLDEGSSWQDGSGSTFTLPNGTYAANKVQVRQSDVAGNLSDLALSTSVFVIDAVTPDTPTFALDSDTGQSDSDLVSNDGTVLVSGLEAGASWQYSVDGGTVWVNGTDDTFTLSEAVYAVGDIQVRQINSVGTPSDISSNTAAITIDNTAPDAPNCTLAVDSGQSDVDNITNDGTITVSGLEANATWEYSLDGTSWLDGTGSSFTLTEDKVYAVDSLLIRQTDIAGNQSTNGTNTDEMTLDTTITDVGSVFGWSVSESSETGIAVGTIDIVDDTLDTTLTYSLTDDAGGLFTIDADTGVISVAGTLDYATNQQHQVTAKATDVAGNESEGYYWISVQQAAPNTGGDNLVDGVEVKTETATENGEEVEIVTVDPVSGDRQDTDDTSNSADIPLHSDDDGEPVTTISLPEGVGFTSYGNETARENNGIADLIGMINDVASIREVNSMTSGGRSFLSLLVADSSELWANEITLTTNSDTPPSDPITIQGNSNGNGIEALVIDASNLPPGTVLDLSDVEFAVVIGPATLTGGGGSNLVYAGEGSQTIILGEDDDELHGGDGDDIVGSEGGDDLLFGDAGNDTLFGGAGMDTLHGGSDTDLVTYDGNKDDYTIEQENGVLTITRKDDTTDSDTLINVEQVQFADQTMAIEYDQDNSILATLYGQVLGRQADVSGFQWWANEGDTGTAAGRMVLCMLDSEEYRESHDDFDFLAQTQEQQIATLYEAVLGREVDETGQADWLAHAENGMSMETIAQSLVESAELTGVYLAKEEWDFIMS